MDPVITIENVSKIFCRDIDLSRSYAIADMFRLGRSRPSSLRRGEFFALRDISFTVEPKEVLLVLGTPDSGISTLAGLLRGVLKPDMGRIEIAGKLQFVTGGKMGFTPLMTLRESILLALTLLGAPLESRPRLCEEITDFCEMRPFSNTKMFDLHPRAVRNLIFSIPLFVESDIFLLDRIPYMGNRAFQQKFAAKFDDITQDRTGILLTSRVKRLPERIHRAIILHDGSILWSGDAEEGIEKFQMLMEFLENNYGTPISSAIFEEDPDVPDEDDDDDDDGIGHGFVAPEVREPAGLQGASFLDAIEEEVRERHKKEKRLIHAEEPLHSLKRVLDQVLAEGDSIPFEFRQSVGSIRDEVWQKLRAEQEAGAPASVQAPAETRISTKNLYTAAKAVGSIDGLKKEISQILQGEPRVFLGPWVSYLGFEASYWIPLLRWVMREFGVGKERFVSISRCGADPWYKDLCAEYVDMLDLVSSGEFESRNEERLRTMGGQKQNKVSVFEADALRDVAERLGLDKFQVLHPSIMYKFFSLVWKGALSLDEACECMEFRDLPVPEAVATGADLPREFIAVALTSTPYFPDNEENRLYVSNLVSSLSAQMDVVVVSTGLYVDGFGSFRVDPGARVHLLDGLLQSRSHLSALSGILSRARALVSTFGGISTLAPFYRVPSLTIYAHSLGNFQTHFDVLRKAQARLGDVPLEMCHRDRLNIDFLLSMAER